MKTKKCTKCGEEKPETDDHFGRQWGNKSLFRNVCKKCRWLQDKEHKSTRADNHRVLVTNYKTACVQDKEGDDTLTQCRAVKLYCHNADEGCPNHKTVIIDTNDTRRKPRYVCHVCKELGSPYNRLTESG